MIENREEKKGILLSSNCVGVERKELMRRRKDKDQQTIEPQREAEER